MRESECSRPRPRVLPRQRNGEISPFQRYLKMGASTADCIQQLAESIPDGQQPIPAEKQETAASRGLVALFVCPALLSEALFSLSSLVLKEQRYAIMMPAAFNGTSIRQVEF